MADGLYAVFHRFEAFLKKVDAQAVTVGFPSNGRRASSISALPAPAAQTSAGQTACSCLQWPAVLPMRPHRPLLLPPLAVPCGDDSLTPQSNQCPRTPLRMGIHCRVFPGSASSPS